MAERELAEKLARRLALVDQSSVDEPVKQPPPLPPPMPVEKVEPNPYVASDPSISIDDLIHKAIDERKAELNNNNKESHPPMTPNHSVTTNPVSILSAAVIVKDQPTEKPPPPLSLANLCKAEAVPDLDAAAVNRRPLFRVEHHKERVGSPSRALLKQTSEETELERVLAAQRRKKQQQKEENTQETELPPPPPKPQTPTKLGAVEFGDQPLETRNPPIALVKPSNAPSWVDVVEQTATIQTTISQSTTIEPPRKSPEKTEVPAVSSENIEEPTEAVVPEIPSVSRPPPEFKPPPPPLVSPQPVVDPPSNHVSLAELAQKEMDSFERLEREIEEQEMVFEEIKQEVFGLETVPEVPEGTRETSPSSLAEISTAGSALSSRLKSLSAKVARFDEEIYDEPLTVQPPGSELRPERSLSKESSPPPPPPPPPSDRSPPVSDPSPSTITPEDPKKPGAEADLDELISGLIKDGEEKRPSSPRIPPPVPVVKPSLSPTALLPPPPALISQIQPPKPPSSPIPPPPAAYANVTPLSVQIAPETSKPHGPPPDPPSTSECPPPKPPRSPNTPPPTMAPPPPPPKCHSPQLKSPLSPLGLPLSPTITHTPTPPMSPLVKAPPKPPVDPEKELAAMLDRRNKILEGEHVEPRVNTKLSLYAEFPQFSRKQIKHFQEMFKKFDEDKDNFIDFMELKRMMEALGEAQTHITLKGIIKKVDEDEDGKISMREFFLIFKLAATGELGVSSEVFQKLADSIDVTKEGVNGAANFFEAKIAELTKKSAFEEEIRQEQEERKQLEEERKKSRAKFQESRKMFQ